MEKLWNLSKTAVPMKKLWNFRFGGKKVRAFLKKNGGEMCPDLKMWFKINVCCFGYHFTRPSSMNLPGYSASLGRLNTC